LLLPCLWWTIKKDYHRLCRVNVTDSGF